MTSRLTPRPAARSCRHLSRALRLSSRGATLNTANPVPLARGREDPPTPASLAASERLGSCSRGDRSGRRLGAQGEDFCFLAKEQSWRTTERTRPLLSRTNGSSRGNATSAEAPVLLWHAARRKPCPASAPHRLLGDREDSSKLLPRAGQARSPSASTVGGRGFSHTARGGQIGRLSLLSSEMLYPAGRHRRQGREVPRS
jgi:hypothetical protein